jgi:hypothetical protein
MMKFNDVGRDALVGASISGALLSCADETGEKRVLAPWLIHPYEPVTWLEMLQFSASSFYWCGHILAELMADCVLGSLPETAHHNMSLQIG